jgi:hypothetical protein
MMDSSGMVEVAWQAAQRSACILAAVEPWVEGFIRDQLELLGRPKRPVALFPDRTDTATSSSR